MKTSNYYPLPLLKPKSAATKLAKTKNSLGSFASQVGFADWTPQYKLGSIVGGLLLVSLAVYALRNAINKSRANYASGQALVPRSYANWASRLNQAFYDNAPFMAYGGTDEKAIFAVIAEMRSQTDFSRTAREYTIMYPGRSLTADLQAELSSSDFQKLTTLQNRKPA